VNWKSQALAFIFGMLVILIIFGDAVQVSPVGNLSQVGNLDTIFGETYWRLIDVLYPLASILTFLFYGGSRGRIKITPATILLFIAFLVSLGLIQLDDFFVLFNHVVALSETYWFVARLQFLFVSAVTFFAFGWKCEKLK
jgi:hypothetical protein